MKEMYEIKDTYICSHRFYESEEVKTDVLRMEDNSNIYELQK